MTSQIAMILAGGAARGAYEVGVVQHIIEEVGRDLGRIPAVDTLCGTSVGAINACALAAFADDPQLAIINLLSHWHGLRVAHVVRVDGGGVLSLFKGLIGRGGGQLHGFLDPAGLQRIVTAAIPFDRISENLRSGKLAAITVSTTHVASGKVTVFVQRDQPGLPPWGRDQTVVARACTLTAEHALASAAIPFLFPPVALDGEWHCDGGLRQNVPLSPARRLGARGLIVISPKFVSNDTPPPGSLPDTFPSPIFLLGKVLNSLLLDRVENDLDRLRRISAIMDAGGRAFGPDFGSRLNAELGRADEQSIRPIEAVYIRASQSISGMAAEFVRSPEFSDRASGPLAYLMRRLGEGADESDLLSYLLFDGEFARRLIELGRKDAAAQHDELCALFTKLAS